MTMMPSKSSRTFSHNFQVALAMNLLAAFSLEATFSRNLTHQLQPVVVQCAIRAYESRRERFSPCPYSVKEEERKTDTRNSLINTASSKVEK